MNALDKIVEMFPNRFGEIDLTNYQTDNYAPRVKSAGQYKVSLKDRLKQKPIWGDKTGFGCDEYFRFRPFELTVWTGYKGHGKSALMSQVLLNFLTQQKKVFVISPEFPPVELLFRFLVQLLACPDPNEEEAEFMLDLMAETLWLYDVQASLKPNDVPALCRWVMEKIKPDHIVIDSLMKCGIDPDDYSKQKKLVDQVQSIAHQNPVHIHLVAHARKGQSDEHPPRIHDIKGASEIGDLVENVVCVWRNKPKEKAMKMGQMDLENDPDAFFNVEAQRNCGGGIGSVPLYFRQDCMIFFEPGHSYRDYVSIGRREVSL